MYKTLINKRRKIFTIIISVILVSILLISGCGKKEKEDVIKIGAILPLTGPFSAFGQEYKRIINMALHDINCNKKIDIHYEDGMGDVKNSLSAYRSLNLKYKPDIIISILSNVCMALKPIILSNNQIFFAEAADPNITKQNPGTIFRHSQTSIQEAEILSNYLDANNSILISLVPSDDYYNSLIESLGDRGVLINTDYYNKSEYDKNFIYKSIKKSKNEENGYLFLGGYGVELGKMIKDARTNDYKKKIFTSLSSFILPGVKKATGKYFYEIYAPNFVIDTTDVDYIELRNKYKEEYNVEMPIYSLLEYNTIFLIGKTLNNIKAFSVENFSKQLKSLNEIKGIGETMIIKDNGDINPKLEIMEL